MGLEGIPAFYIHSLLATPNDLSGVEKMGYNRAINRHRWNYGHLQELLDDPASTQSRALREMKRLVGIRTGQPAFHPNATQFTLQLGPSLFGFWRQSIDRSQSIFAIHNLGSEPANLPSLSLNLIDGERWYDLLAPNDKVEADGVVHLAPYQCRWITNRQTV
jgi:sucrose phosphorylase